MHDELVGDGTWARTRHGYVHFNYNKVSDYLIKMDRYTDADVRCSLPDTPPTSWRGAVDVVRALYLYYLKWRGNRDGWIGLLDAGMRGIYQFVYWAKPKGVRAGDRGDRRTCLGR